MFQKILKLKPKNLLFLYLLFRMICLFGHVMFKERLSIDVIENVIWGKEWQLGYYKHPPLFAWMAYIVYSIFNKNPYLYYYSVFFFSSIAIYLTYLLIHEIENHNQISDKIKNTNLNYINLNSSLLPLLSAISLDLISFYNIGENRFNANTASLFFPPLIALLTYKIYLYNKIKHWFYFGLSAGLAVLCKYSGLLSVFPCFLFLIYHFGIKKILQNKGAYVSILVFFVILTPHILWLIQNDFLPIIYISSQMKTRQNLNELFLISNITKVTKFITIQFFYTMPLWLVVLYLKVTTKGKKLINSQYLENKNLAFVLLNSVFLLFFLIILQLVKNTQFCAKWTMTFYFLFPYLFFKLSNLKNEKIVQIIKIHLLYFIIAISTFTTIMYKDKSNKAQKINSYTIQQKWKNRYGEYPKFIAGYERAAEEIAFFNLKKNSKIKVWINCNLKISPWIDIDEVKKNGFILTATDLLGIRYYEKFLDKQYNLKSQNKVEKIEFTELDFFKGEQKGVLYFKFYK